MTDKYLGVVLEDIREQNKAVLNAVSGMQQQMKLLATQQSLNELTDRVDTIQAVLIADRKDFFALEKRVTVLETAAA